MSSLALLCGWRTCSRAGCVFRFSQLRLQKCPDLHYCCDFFRGLFNSIGGCRIGGWTVDIAWLLTGQSSTQHALARSNFLFVRVRRFWECSEPRGTFSWATYTRMMIRFFLTRDHHSHSSKQFFSCLSLRDSGFSINSSLSWAMWRHSNWREAYYCFQRKQKNRVGHGLVQLHPRCKHDLLQALYLHAKRYLEHLRSLLRQTFGARENEEAMTFMPLIQMTPRFCCPAASVQRCWYWLQTAS